MGNLSLSLENLGWTDWFEHTADCGPAESVARVAAVDRNQLLLMDQSGAFRARLAGSFLGRRRDAQDLPCVGDWVCVEKPPDDGIASIHSRLERRTSLRRKAVGESVEFQMIAANVDCVIVVQSCHFDFNLKRLERYLVMVRDGGAEPLVLLTKTDLVEPAVLAAQLDEIRAAGIEAPVMMLSNVTHAGVDEFRQLLQPGRTYCFVGSSGVGKSTLINRLAGRDVQQTKAVSGTGEGRHTTTRRELLVLEGGALVIDNPGMREFGVGTAGGDVDENFADIIALAANCRFRDCTHTNEPGCAVLEAVEAGEISRDHYENHLKLKDESAFNQMSYAEKRHKDRNFGRFIKSAKKDRKG